MTSDREAIAAAFDRRAATYSRSDWHRQAAERLVALCGPPPGARVLDAGTGTGFAAMAVARAIGPGGRVLGVDLSPGMLREARASVEHHGLANVELWQGDATRLADVATASFDAVTCAAGLLYMPVAEALAEWHRLLRPGGVLAFSGMAEGWPLPGRLFRECAAAAGVTLRDPSAPLGTEARCAAALQAAGFTTDRIVREQVSFSPKDLEAAWESNVRSANHADVLALPAAELAALRGAFDAAMAAAARDRPEHLTRAAVLYAIGRRPAEAAESAAG